MKCLFILTLFIVSANAAIPWADCETHKCLIWNNNTTNCEVKDCWQYDETAGCERAGAAFVPALVLQCIPFTGFFGSGFGNMGRWDIFNWYLLADFLLPTIFLCVVCCCWCWLCKPPEPGQQPLLGGTSDQSAGFTILAGACGCVWAVLLITMWVWGIVVIAGKQVEAPWTSYNGDKIMCPLVG